MCVGLKASEIHEAVKKDDLISIKKLIQNNSKLVHLQDENKRTPLHYASEWGHSKIVKLLLIYGSEINSAEYKFCPGLSPDGKFFYYTSDRGGKYNVYWVDTKVIKELRPKNFK